MNENEGVRVREARCCLLCGCEGTQLYTDLRDRLFSAPGNWELMQCLKCQLVWLNPRPIPDDIGRLYSQYYTHKILDSPNNVLASIRKIVKAGILQSSYGYKMMGSNRLAGFVLSGLGPIKEIAGGCVQWLIANEKGRILDVGRGSGAFLVKMRELGWNVVGVEPYGEAVRNAHDIVGLGVHHGTLEEAKFSDDYFDAITQNHVIEHMRGPIGLLKECRRALKLGGKLVVVIPNIDSLGTRMFGYTWLHWDPPRHLILFSTQKLQECAMRSGLIIQELRTTKKEGRSSWAVNCCIKRDGMPGMLPGVLPKTLGILLRLKGLAFQAVEYELSGRGKAGAELVLLATK